MNGANFELGEEYWVDVNVQQISNESITVVIYSSPKNILNWVTMSILVGRSELFALSTTRAESPVI